MIARHRAYKDPAQLRGTAGAGRRRRQHRLRHRGRGGPAGRRAAGTRPAAVTGTRPSTCYGRPADQVNDAGAGAAAAAAAAAVAVHAHAAATVGDLTRFGLPAPDHQLYETHPIVNSQLLVLRRARRDHPGAGRGAVRPRRGRADRRHGASSRTWSSSPPATCRGSSSSRRSCSISTPRAGRDCFCTRSRARHPTLAVAGLLQPDSGVFSLVHWQTVAIARWLRLRDAAPGHGRGAVARSMRPSAGAVGSTGPRSSTPPGTGSRSATSTTCGRSERTLRRTGGERA